MKKTFYSLAILSIALVTSFSSCKKDPAPETSLTISVSDELGNKVSGATVVLYPTLSDYLASTNIIATDNTDATGNVSFKKLSSVKYYYTVIKDCKNNVNGNCVLTSALTLNMSSRTNVVITPTGSLKFVNNSTNPYQVFVNGTATISSLPGGSNMTIPYNPTGAYTLRVLQISGYVLTPTDKSFTGTLTCGSTLTTTFP